MIQKALTMTSKGTFTLPAAVRKQLGLTEAGSKVLLTFDEKTKTIELSGVPSVETIRARNSEFLRQQGFTAKGLRQLAQHYENGHGLEAGLRERYEQK